MIHHIFAYLGRTLDWEGLLRGAVRRPGLDFRAVVSRLRHTGGEVPLGLCATLRTERDVGPMRRHCNAHRRESAHLTLFIPRGLSIRQGSLTRRPGVRLVRLSTIGRIRSVQGMSVMARLTAARLVAGLPQAVRPLCFLLAVTGGRWTAVVAVLCLAGLSCLQRCSVLGYLRGQLFQLVGPIMEQVAHCSLTLRSPVRNYFCS